MSFLASAFHIRCLILELAIVLLCSGKEILQAVQAIFLKPQKLQTILQLWLVIYIFFRISYSHTIRSFQSYHGNNLFCTIVDVYILFLIQTCLYSIMSLFTLLHVTFGYMLVSEVTHE